MLYIRWSFALERLVSVGVAFGSLVGIGVYASVRHFLPDIDLWPMFISVPFVSCIGAIIGNFLDLIEVNNKGALISSFVGSFLGLLFAVLFVPFIGGISIFLITPIFSVLFCVIGIAIFEKYANKVAKQPG